MPSHATCLGLAWFSSETVTRWTAKSDVNGSCNHGIRHLTFCWLCLATSCQYTMSLTKVLWRICIWRDAHHIKDAPNWITESTPIATANDKYSFQMFCVWWDWLMLSPPARPATFWLLYRNKQICFLQEFSEGVWIYKNDSAKSRTSLNLCSKGYEPSHTNEFIPCQYLLRK